MKYIYENLSGEPANSHEWDACASFNDMKHEWLFVRVASAYSVDMFSFFFM